MEKAVVLRLKAADFLALFYDFVDSDVLLVSSKFDRGCILIKMTFNKIYDLWA
jgi:hypothetical protein